MRAADPGRALAGSVRVKASRLAGGVRRSLPPAWAAVAAGLDAMRLAARCRSAVVARLGRPADRLPSDPLRALRLGGARGGARWSSSARTRIRPPATPTAWRSRPRQAAGRARWRSVFEVLAEARPGLPHPRIWSLDSWARQGVLLLNPVLTVEVGRQRQPYRLWLAGAHCARSSPSVPSDRVAAGVPALGCEGRRALLAPAQRRGLARTVSDDPRTRPTTSTASFMAEGNHFAAPRPPRRLVGHRLEQRPAAVL